MNPTSHAGDLSVIQASVLDHASEFVEIVYSQAPRAYRALLASGRFDTRLARAGGYRQGQTVSAANHRWKIVGIVPAGAGTASTRT